MVEIFHLHLWKMEWGRGLLGRTGMSFITEEITEIEDDIEKVDSATRA